MLYTQGFVSKERHTFVVPDSKSGFDVGITNSLTESVIAQIFTEQSLDQRIRGTGLQVKYFSLAATNPCPDPNPRGIKFQPHTLFCHHLTG